LQAKFLPTLIIEKIWRAWNEGKKLGLKIRNSEGVIDINKAPLVRFNNIVDKILFLTFTRYLSILTDRAVEVYKLDE
jgi:hypothetical protein